MDEETGLYYFGARYYDPRTSVWQSADPILGKYLSADGIAGGTRAPINFALYTYGRNSPLIYRDPDGRFVFLIPLVVKAVSVGVALYGAYETGHAVGTAVNDVVSGNKTVGEAVKDGAINVGTNVALTASGMGAVKVAKKFLPKDAEKQVMERIKRIYSDRGQKIEKHHSDPQFMGGAKKQDLTDTSEKVHDQLHSDMNKHLKEVKNAAGDDMMPRKGNPGSDIRANFTRDERLGALADFYKQNEIRYYEQARDFFKQHPEYK